MPRPSVATSLQHHHASPSSFPALPNPVLSFTIPSIHDDHTTLECRIYHPQSLTPNPSAPPWRKHAAVVAHPYASLGGCYDDAVVETISGTLLRQGFVVGTFNFRGAGNSTGRTSWTGRAERGDYLSFAGFVYYYVHYLDPFRPQKSSEPLRSSVSSTEPLSTNPRNPAPSSPPSATLPSSQAQAGEESPVLMLCGYSYGAMITKLLPPLDALLEPFAAPKTASAAADIRLRAQHLAEKQNTILASARAAAAAALAESPVSPRKAAFGGGGGGGGLRIGGDEDRRRSQEHGRRSFSIDAEDKIRKGVAELMQKAKSHQLGHHHHHHHRRKSKEYMAAVQEETTAAGCADEEKEPDALTPVPDLFTPRVAYLLVSPPVGWATHLMTMNLGGFFGKRPKVPKMKDSTTGDSTDFTDHQPKDAFALSEKQKLLDNPTLAIYGDADVFVAAKRFREWAAKLQSAPGSQFRAHEISTAGHFYVEEGTLQRLADAVRAYASELMALT
ncbi:unnamed protein product [Discula destructiva]